MQSSQLLNKSQSMHGHTKNSGKFPEIASWLEKTRNEDDTEHNIDREHHNWTSEPELWMYQPGLDSRMKSNRSNTKRHLSIFSQGARSRGTCSMRKNSIESPNTDSSSEQEGLDSSGEPISPKVHAGLLGVSSNPKPFSMKSYGRKQYRRHKMKYGKKLQSSKSDSYHKKYIWDMVFNERAMVAIQQEYRQIQKLRAQSTKHRRKNGAKGYNSILSGTSGDDCSQSGSFNAKKLPMSAAAAASLVGDVDDMLLRSASQVQDKRKISQTGSALFAQFDLINEKKKIEKAGRHPAKSSSKEGSDFRTQMKSGVLKRSTEKPARESSMTSPPVVSLENNYNSTGGTDSYNLSSGQMTSTGYPGYPNIPYMDPMMLQAFMMQGIFNPMQMMNYNLAQQQSVYMSNMTNPSTLGSMGNYPSPGMMYPNLSSSSGGYPSMQQDLINQINAGMVQTLATPPRDSVSKSVQPEEEAPVRSNVKRQDSDKESSEESEDIRPSRHAIDDQTNDLHPVKHSKRKESRLKTRNQSFHGAGFTRTKTKTNGGLGEGFDLKTVGQTIHERTSIQSPKLSLHRDRSLTVHQDRPSNKKSRDPTGVKLSPLSNDPAADHFGYSSSKSIMKKKERSTPRSTVVDYLTQLKGCVETLKKSGWYWGNISGENAMKNVERHGLGAFLIRDSTHQKFLFTLTVHTSNGPTNVRIVYRQGLFGLDCDNINQGGVKFDCVVKMIAHYVSNSKKYRRMTNKKKELLDQEAKAGQEQKDNKTEVSPAVDSSSIALLLLSPVRKNCASLSHLARLAVNKKLARKSAKSAGVTLESLTPDQKLRQYCQKYPYTV